MTDRRNSNIVPVSRRSRVESQARRHRWLRAILMGASAWSCYAVNVASLAMATETDDSNLAYWPRFDFVIPFNVDVAGQAPREIELEYSSDGGATWDLYRRADVRAKQFQFQAKSDGEYRFRLKTVDQQGRRFENPGEPLRVYVDSTKPEGELLLQMDRRGAMVAEFSIADATLDTQSVELTYFTQADSKPRQIPVELVADQQPNTWIGNATWTLPNGTQSIAVRLVAKDKAGNSLEINKMPQLPRSAAAQNGLQLASGKTRESNSAPIGTGIADPKESLPKIEVLSGPGAKTNNNAANSDPNLAQIVEQQKLLIERYQTLVDHQSSANRQLANISIPVTNQPSAISTQEKQTNPTPTETLAVKRTEIAPPIAPSSRTNRLPMRALTDEEYEQAVGPNMSLVAKKQNQSILVREDSNTATPRSLDQLAEPTGESSRSEASPNIERLEPQPPVRNNIRPLYSKTKAFSLDYTIDNDPDSPVSAVELWGTTDQGQTWQMWGQDPDRASPFDIQVESEGLFGFRMVIVGANGLASNRPRNGDNADAWIHVDTQRPHARIQSALYGKGKESGSLIIEYTADDDYLPDRPIAFSYSENPEGPWKTIASGIRNNNRYVWPADPNLPQTIYLRMEVLDAAGNVGVHRLETPIDVQGLAPRGRIQGFRPYQGQP